MAMGSFSLTTGNLAFDEELSGVRFLLRDRDAKFTGPFGEVFRIDGAVKVPRCPDRNVAAVREARDVFERMGAAPWLDRLGEA